jgi:UDP-N-acetylglucosamine 2-epimerase (non-hydrolysing)
MQIKIAGVVGARPNFMKIDPLFRALERELEIFSTQLIHTGQHYDDSMSEVFFKDLGLRPPDIYLGIGSGTHAEQTGKIMMSLEKVLMEERPDLLVVVGDVNSTLAGAVTAAKLRIPIAHVEAGLRSFDRRMPEEINRVVTDALSNYLFTPSCDANENLRREGIPNEKIYFVGNIMIDSLKRCLKLAEKSDILKTLKVKPEQYALLTLHRPSNVDDPQVLEEILEAIAEIQKEIAVVFPIHPRTKKQIKAFGLKPKVESMKNLKIVPPVGYIDFLALETNAKLILTDSGGVQEETTVLGIPCLTLRETTERPVTVTQGTNQVVGHNRNKIVSTALSILHGQKIATQIPEFWDGHTSERIVAILKSKIFEVQSHSES